MTNPDPSPTEKCVGCGKEIKKGTGRFNKPEGTVCCGCMEKTGGTATGKQNQ